MTNSPSKPHKESGQSLVLFTFLMTTLLLVISLVVDIGMLTLERRNVQNAADAAALAGARMLPDDPGTAMDDATTYALANGVEEDEILAINVTTTDLADDTIEVEVQREVPFGFAKLAGIFSGTVSVRAVARTGGVVGSSALAPFAVEESVFDGLEQGDTTTLKYNATNSDNGNFLPLSLDNTGSSEYEENVKFGSDQWLCAEGHETSNCVSIASTEPGNMVGGTRSALNWAFAHTTTSCDTYEEVFVDLAASDTRFSLNPECNRFTNPSVQSYRLVLVPVIDELCGGRCDVTVQRFAMMFIESYTCGGQGQGNSCDLVGRYARAEGSVSGVVGQLDEQDSVKSVRLIE